jgi:catechol 2,3-dioxygenase-like lactoylglutathione lyase family enzyme
MSSDEIAAAPSDRKGRPTLARISLWTGDPERLEAFYSRLFGFERIFARSVTDPDIVGSWNLPSASVMDIVLLRSPRGDTELGITSARHAQIAVRPTRRDGPPSIGAAYIVLYVPSLDDVLRRLGDLDATFNRAPKRVGDPAGRTFYEAAIYDPDGTVLLVVEETTP